MFLFQNKLKSKMYVLVMFTATKIKKLLFFNADNTISFKLMDTMLCFK